MHTLLYFVKHYHYSGNIITQLRECNFPEDEKYQFGLQYLFILVIKYERIVYWYWKSYF